MKIDKVKTEVIDEEIFVKLLIGLDVITFRTENTIANLLEGKAFVQLLKPAGPTMEIPFHFKLNSDTNRDQWSRILARALDPEEKANKYPWPLIVNQACAEIEEVLANQKQDFEADEIEAKDTTWMLEPFIQEDQINTFFGMGASGKTMLSIYLASATDSRVLFIDYENDDKSWKSKLVKMGINSKNFVYFDSLQIPLFEQVDKIKEVIKARGIKLVIVDSASLASGESTSDEGAALKLFSGLKLLRTTTILIAHQRKNDGDKNPIGSIQYENQARNVWNLISKRSSEDHVLHVAAKHTKANNTFIRKNPLGFKVTFGEAITVEKENAIHNFEEKFTVADRIEKFLTEEGPTHYKQIAEALDLSPSTVAKNGTNNRSRFINNNGVWRLPQ